MFPPIFVCDFFCPFFLLLPTSPEIRKHFLDSAANPQLAAFLFTVSPISSDNTVINYTDTRAPCLQHLKYYAEAGQVLRTINHGDPAKVNSHKNTQEDKVSFLFYFLQLLAIFLYSIQHTDS